MCPDMFHHSIMFALCVYVEYLEIRSVQKAAFDQMVFLSLPYFPEGTYPYRYKVNGNDYGQIYPHYQSDSKVKIDDTVK